MLTPDEAARQIVDRLHPLEVERVALEQCLGRVLGTPITAPIALPPWDNSAMDGYAVRTADIKGASGASPVVLSILEEVSAGAFPTKPVGAGQATRIFTGAPTPDGADCVIRQEDTERRANDAVAILSDRDAGRNIRPRGEDMQAGERLFEQGQAIGPAQLGVLASIATQEATVHRRPRVGILSTGDEIADVHEAEAILAGQKIASSNSYTLAANVAQSGAIPVKLGIAGDDAESLRRHLERVSELDLLITTAGVSVGEHDHVRSVLNAMGLELVFWRIRMRPGSPLGFGMLGELPWLGLPGNPVSTMVTYELFAHPAIRRLSGHMTCFRQTIPVVAGEEISLGPTLRHFLRCQLHQEEDRTVATLTGPQGSGLLTSMARADGLLVIPEDRPRIAAGELLIAIPFGNPTHIVGPPY